MKLEKWYMSMNTIKYGFSLIVTYCLISNSFAQQSNIIDSLENLLQTSPNDSSEVIIRMELFQLYLFQDTSRSNHHLNQIKKITENEIIEISSQRLFQLGQLYLNYKNDYNNSNKYFELAIQKSKKENNFNYVDYESWLGYYLSNSGESEKGLQCLLNASEIAENNKLSKKLPLTYVLLAFVYRNINELGKADVYFKKAIDISNQIGDSAYIHTSLHEIGNLYCSQGDYKNAIDFHKQALLIRERNNTLNGSLIFSYNDIANVYLLMDSLNIAMSYYLKAEKLVEQYYDGYALNNIYSNIIEVYLRLNMHHQAEKYLRKMQNLTAQLNIKSAYHSLSYSYYKYYKASNQFEKALLYYESAVSYRDSITSEEVQKNISELDKKYETAKKDRELLKNQEHIKRQRIIIFFVIIGMLIITVFMFIVFRQYRQKKEAYIKLEIKNKEIQQQQEELRKLNSTKDKFFSIIAHDLRGPIGSMMQIAELVSEDKLDEETLHMFLNSQKELSQSTFHLLENLLNWARYSNEQIQFKPNCIVLNSIIDENIINIKFRAKQKGISIITDCSEIFQVYADEEMVKLVIRNLLSNSIKFTSAKGFIRIEIENKLSAVEIRITDTGIGISHENITKILSDNVFYSTNGTHSEKGTGLGLKLCKNFIDTNKGSFHIESVLGKGTSFIVTLPTCS